MERREDEDSLDEGAATLHTLVAQLTALMLKMQRDLAARFPQPPTPLCAQQAQNTQLQVSIETPVASRKCAGSGTTAADLRSPNAPRSRPPPQNRQENAQAQPFREAPQAAHS